MTAFWQALGMMATVMAISFLAGIVIGAVPG